MRITWEVEDGYAGKSRPQYTEVPDVEIEACESEDEENELINEYIQRDFEMKISYSWT